MKNWNTDAEANKKTSSDTYNQVLSGKYWMTVVSSKQTNTHSSNRLVLSFLLAFAIIDLQEKNLSCLYFNFLTWKIK